MKPPAETAHPIHELLRHRWSPRAFADAQVMPDQLRTLFEAARWAPSSFNEQPWGFILTTRDDPEPFGRLLATLTERNRSWASRAPVLILSVARLRFARNGKPNRHALHDVGMAVENLVIQATALGLVVHQMAGFDVDKAREAFGIGEGLEPVAAIALGLPGDPESLPDGLRERELEPRARRPLEEFVFGGRWGAASSLVVDPGGGKDP